MSLTDIMSAAGLSSWTELALILCFVVFTAIVIWVFFVRGKLSYEHMRGLPLDDNGNGDMHTTLRGGDLS
jgi:cbb3-type cytochrome oxidase subunit 3